MMSEKTAAHDLAVRMIGDENQAIFFVGYADPDTPGGRLEPRNRAKLLFSAPAPGRSLAIAKSMISISPRMRTAKICWTLSDGLNRASLVGPRR